MADSEDASSPAPAPAGGAPQPLPKAPRLHAPTIAQRRAAPATPGDVDPEISLAELVAWARSFDGTVQPPAAEPKEAQPAPQRAHISREKRKFHKFDPEAARAEQEAREARASAAAALVAPSAQAAEPASPEAEVEDEPRGISVSEDPRKALRKPKSEPRSLLSSLLVQCLVLVLMGASYLLGRATVPAGAAVAYKPPAPIPADSDKTPAILSSVTMDMIDQAIAAVNAGDVKKASAIFDQARHTSSHINGLDFHLALLAYHTGDFATAILSLNRSLAAGEYVAECYGIRGLIANRQGVTQGLHDFEAATQADPFDAKAFFYWGEALRRAGKPQSAIIRLRQAVERSDSPTDLARYMLKVRLTQIELGQEKDFADQLAKEMVMTSPPAEWVLTSAAEQMHAGNYSAAALQLNWARDLMGSTALASALGDYFFAGYANKPPIAQVYAEVFPARKPAPASATPGATPADDFPVSLTPQVQPPVAPTAAP